MAIVSYIDDSACMARAFVERNYNFIDDLIECRKENISSYLSQDEILVGYDITVNESLSALYDIKFYVVKFLFKNINTLHEDNQYKLLVKLFGNLKEHIEQNKGYYSMRLPIHIVDLLKVNNKVLPNGVFCGGTVEEIVYGKKLDYPLDRDAKILLANKDYVDNYRDNLLKIAYESFENYQGHYHISQVTDYKAGEIYKDWLRRSLEHFSGNLVVAEYMGIPAGFATISETDYAIEGVLTAVDNQYRNKGLYKSMIAYLVNLAESKGKGFIISTQFDNYIVQGVWSSMGLKPYCSIYNIHING